MVRTTGLKNYSNVHFTDRKLAAEIIDFYAPKGKVLEPFRGDGAFFDPLTSYAKTHAVTRVLWCETSQGIDFLKHAERVNWIISNPPFGPLTEMMEKAFDIADNTVFLIPISKHFSSAPRLKLSRANAGLKHILHVGTGREIGFDIGFPFGAMHFQKGYSGPIYETEIAEWRKYRSLSATA